MLAEFNKPICPLLWETNINTKIANWTHHNEKHLMTFDPNCDLILGFPFGQQGKISSGVFAYIDKPHGTLSPKSAHTS